jgi:hypothetical protein
MSYKKLVVITLWLIAFHSIGVGIGMILFPANWIAFFDIVPSEHRFFITQGGVFHIVMTIAYGMAANDVSNSTKLITFSIVVKFCAASFLFLYFIFINQFGIVFLSGIGDFCMGLVLLIVYKKYQKTLSV